jgi:uncharacterized protein involved in exopolysaccharide biosynthesis
MTDRDSKAVQEAKLHFLDYWRVVRLRLPIIVLTFLLVVITAGITTYFLPRQYESNVIIEVEQNDQKIRIFREGYEGGMGLDPRFATTQFQIIQRKEMLYPVIDSLKLVEHRPSGIGGSGQLHRQRIPAQTHRRAAENPHALARHAGRRGGQAAQESRGDER